MFSNDKNSFSYQDRVVAFIDVLGFADLVTASGTNQDALAKINKLIGVNNLFDAFMKKLSFASATFFSDSFVVSMLSSQDRILYMVREVGYLCRYLLLKGLPCRGAISVGPLHHHERIVIGPAFVSAYRLEQSVANYPRIILDDEAILHWRHEFRVDEFGGGPGHPHLASLVKRDRDGQHFIDIFNPEWGRNFIPWTEMVVSEETIPTDADQFLKAARERIHDGLVANIVNPKIRAKYEWLASECRERAKLE